MKTTSKNNLPSAYFSRNTSKNNSNIINNCQLFIKETSYKKQSKTIIYEQTLTNMLASSLQKLNIENIIDFSKDNILSFVSYLKNVKKNSNNTINKLINFLKRVFKYFSISSFLFDIKSLKDDTNSFNALTEKELQEIKLALSLLKNTSNNLIYQVLLLLLLNTGLRINEALNIKIKNINFLNNTIFLEKTKNGQKTTIVFPKTIAFFLQKIIQLKERQYLFYNIAKKRQMDYQKDIKNFFKRLSQKVGFKVHSHQFRKSYATILYNQTFDYFLINKLLRHKSMKTTKIYIDTIDKTHFDKLQQNAHVFTFFTPDDKNNK